MNYERIFDEARRKVRAWEARDAQRAGPVNPVTRSEK